MTARTLAPKPSEHAPEWRGAPGLVAAIMRQAVEEADGRLFRVPESARTRVQAEARAWLSSDAWEARVSACGADPGVIRRELERRCEWMQAQREGAG